MFKVHDFIATINRIKYNFLISVGKVDGRLEETDAFARKSCTSSGKAIFSIKKKPSEAVYTLIEEGNTVNIKLIFPVGLEKNSFSDSKYHLNC